MEELHNKENNSKLEDLEKIIEGFSELLTAENQALREFDVDKVSAMYDQKAKIVSAYRTMSAYFIKNQQLLEEISPEQKLKLRQQSQQLDSLLKENELLLKTRMQASKQVMDTIINIAKVTNNNNATSYGAQGRYSPLDNNKNALALNRTL